MWTKTRWEGGLTEGGGQNTISRTLTVVRGCKKKTPHTGQAMGDWEGPRGPEKIGWSILGGRGGIINIRTCKGRAGKWGNM